jgi:hypothetical protein
MVRKVTQHRPGQARRAMRGSAAVAAVAIGLFPRRRRRPHARLACGGEPRSSLTARRSSVRGGEHSGRSAMIAAIKWGAVVMLDPWHLARKYEELYGAVRSFMRQRSQLGKILP